MLVSSGSFSVSCRPWESSTESLAAIAALRLRVSKFSSLECRSRIISIVIYAPFYVRSLPSRSVLSGEGGFAAAYPETPSSSRPKSDLSLITACRSLRPTWCPPAADAASTRAAPQSASPCTGPTWWPRSLDPSRRRCRLPQSLLQGGARVIRSDQSTEYARADKSLGETAATAPESPRDSPTKEKSHRRCSRRESRSARLVDHTYGLDEEPHLFSALEEIGPAVPEPLPLFALAGKLADAAGCRRDG